MQISSAIPTTLELRASREQLVPILLVDDDEIPIISIKRAMKAASVDNPTFVARDGEQALGILRDMVAENGKLPPIVILLDLNMPRMNGLEAIAEIRSDHSLRQALIFVHSTSSQPSDISEAYDMNVAGYILKSGSTDEMKEVVEMLRRFTSEIVFPMSA